MAYFSVPVRCGRPVEASPQIRPLCSSLTFLFSHSFVWRITLKKTSQPGNIPPIRPLFFRLSRGLFLVIPGKAVSSPLREFPKLFFFFFVGCSVSLPDSCGLPLTSAWAPWNFPFFFPTPGFFKEDVPSAEIPPRTKNFPPSPRIPTPPGSILIFASPGGIRWCRD